MYIFHTLEGLDRDAVKLLAEGEVCVFQDFGDYGIATFEGGRPVIESFTTRDRDEAVRVASHWRD